MRRSITRGGSAVLLCLLTALSAPATGVAQDTYTTPASTGISLSGPKVKKFRFNGSGFKTGNTVNHFLGLNRGGAGNNESHSYNFDGGTVKLNASLSRGSWKIDMGSYGKLKLRFRATKKARTSAPADDCTGDRAVSRRGKLRGTLRLKAGAYFKTIKLRRAKGTATRRPENVCKFTELGGQANQAISLFGGGDTATLNVFKEPNGKVVQSLFVRENPTVQRSISATSTTATAFTAADNASSASVQGIGPRFSGTATYTAADYYPGGSSGSITGDFGAKFATGTVKLFEAAPVVGNLNKPGFTPPPPPNQAPVAGASGQQTYNAPGEVQFFDESYDPDGEIVSWSWDFGDGATSTERNPLHTYAAPAEGSEPDTYTATLTVTDDRGTQTTTSTQVTVEYYEVF